MQATTVDTNLSFLSLIQDQMVDDILVPLNISGNYQLSELYSFDLKCAVRDDAMSTWYESKDQMLYKPMGVQITANAEGARFFHGIVTAITADISHKHCTFTIEPALAKSKQTLRNRVFTHQSILKVVQTVIEEQTKSDAIYFKTTVSPAITDNPIYQNKKPLIIQYQESDFDFISRLLAQLGIFYYFEFQEDQHIMHLHDDNTRLTMLSEMIPYDSHAQRSDRSLHSWKQINKVGVTNVVVDDYDPDHVTIDLQSGKLNDASINYQVFPGGYNSKDAANQLAANIQNAQNVKNNYSTACCDRLDIFPGQCIQRLDDNGDVSQFLIIGQHVNASGHAQHTQRALSSTQNSFQSTVLMVPLAEQYQPICSHEKPKVYGLQTATVITSYYTNRDHIVHKQPIEVNKDAKVKIRFSWEDPAHTAENAAWVRVMQPSAGKRWGMLFTPRKDDEVLVSFQNGDIDLPIIIGSAYNSVHTPAYDLQQDPYTTGFKMASISKDITDPTRSNELIFYNELYNEKVTLKAERDYSQIVGNDALSVIDGVYKTEVKKGNMLIDVEQGGLLAKASQQITLKVGRSQLVIKPTGVSIIAPFIHLNPHSSGSAVPATLKTKAANAEKMKTQKHRYIQNEDITDK